MDWTNIFFLPTEQLIKVKYNFRFPGYCRITKQNRELGCLYCIPAYLPFV